MSNAIANQEERKKEIAPYVQLGNFLEARKEAFAEAGGVDSARFLRVAKNALLKDPEIAEASAQSVYIECMKAVSDGLVLDGREAALVKMKVNKRIKKNGQWVDNYVTEVVYIPMVLGIIKRVRASGEVKAWTVAAVYSEEFKQGKFSYTAAPDPLLKHDPIIVGDRGEIVAFYSAVKLADDTYHYEVMRRDEVDEIMSRSRSKNRSTGEMSGPWRTDYSEMGKKTVIRRHSKRLPVSSDTMDIASRVDSLYDNPDDEREDHSPEQMPAQHQRKSSAGNKLKIAAKAMEQQAQEDGDEEDDSHPSGMVMDGEIIGRHGEVIENDRGRPEPGDEF